jgi:hypothetical protein
VSQGNTVKEAVNPDLRELFEHFEKSSWDFKKQNQLKR